MEAVMWGSGLGFLGQSMAGDGVGQGTCFLSQSLPARVISSLLASPEMSPQARE